MLKQAEDGTAVGKECRKAGIAEATFHNWRKLYAGLMPSEKKRLRQRRGENGKPKRIVIDVSPARLVILSDFGIAVGTLADPLFALKGGRKKFERTRPAFYRPQV